MLELIGAVVVVLLIAAMLIGGVAVGTILIVLAVLAVIAAVLAFVFNLTAFLLYMGFMILIGMGIRFLIGKGLLILGEKLNSNYLLEDKSRGTVATVLAIAATVAIFI